MKDTHCLPTTPGWYILRNWRYANPEMPLGGPCTVWVYESEVFTPTGTPTHCTFTGNDLHYELAQFSAGEWYGPLDLNALATHRLAPIDGMFADEPM